MKHYIIYLLLGLFLVGLTGSCDKLETTESEQPPVDHPANGDQSGEDPSDGNDDTTGSDTSDEGEEVSDNNLPVGGALKYEVCSEYKYQGNMTLLAHVYKDGEALTHYQIAIFDAEGECRACGWSYPELDGISYLTIQGDDDTGDLTIHVIYQRGKEVREVMAKENLCYYNDATIGSTDEPYTITIAGEKE